VSGWAKKKKKVIIFLMQCGGQRSESNNEKKRVQGLNEERIKNMAWNPFGSL